MKVKLKNTNKSKSIILLPESEEDRSLILSWSKETEGHIFLSKIHENSRVNQKR